MSSDSITPNGLTRREELLAVATKLFAARGPLDCVDAFVHAPAFRENVPLAR